MMLASEFNLIGRLASSSLRIASILAAIGIYGLIAFSVQPRTLEICIHMALGADRAKIRNLAVWHGMRLAFYGYRHRYRCGFWAHRLIASFLFGVKYWDPFVFLTAPY